MASKSAAMIARKEALIKVGGFDEDYFLYVEETDLCWRIWLEGYKVVLSLKSVVYHISGTTNIVIPHKVNYLVKFHGTKNYILTLIKNLEFRSLIKILPIHIVLWMGIAVYFLIKRRYKSFQYIIYGIIWNFSNLTITLNKRKKIQSTRKINDSYLFSRVLKRKSLTYFIKKLQDDRKIGHDVGWDKGE